MKQLEMFKNVDLPYEKADLDETHFIEIHRGVEVFQLDNVEFEQLWNEHPEDFHEVVIHGKRIKTPRWQQAYGKNYEYTGSRNNALPIERIDQRYLD